MAKAGGMALAQNRGPEYMSTIGRNGAYKRQTHGSGRPRLNGDDLACSNMPVSSLSNQRKEVMPATALRTLLDEWGRRERAFLLGKSPI